MRHNPMLGAVLFFIMENSEEVNRRIKLFKHAEEQRAYRKRNKDKIREQNKKWNKKYRKEYQRAYRKKNKK